MRIGNDIPNDGGLEAKWIEPNTIESEKANSIIRPLGSHIAPWQKVIQYFMNDGERILHQKNKST